MYGCNLGCFKNIVRVTHLVVLQHIRNKKRDCKSLFFSVHPWGVEPQSSEPESGILSIELWVLVFYLLQVLHLAISVNNFQLQKY